MIVQPFPSFFFLGTMASADFLTFVVTMFRFEYVYSFSPTRPPRVSVTTFASYICCIYTLKFGQYWTSFCYGNSSVSSMPYMQFLFVRPRLCLRLPSDSTSRWTPLPLANSSYCQVCSGLSPPSDSACRAHIKNTCLQGISRISEAYKSFCNESRRPESQPLMMEEITSMILS